MSTAIDPATLATTRRALHGVAELVLAGPQYRSSGTIRLAVTPGGFGTIAEPALRVEGTELVAGDRVIPMNGPTYGELGTAAGVVAGAPEGLYKGGSGMLLDDTIGVDAGAAEHLEQCFSRGQEALRRLAPDLSPVMWPEHFDLAITLDEINYGVSPGDDYLPEPYAYAGPWQPRLGDFWNAPFGAARTITELHDVDGVLAFFQQGHAIASDN